MDQRDRFYKTIGMIVLGVFLLSAPFVLTVMTRNQSKNPAPNPTSGGRITTDPLVKEEKTESGNTLKGVFADKRYYVSLDGVVAQSATRTDTGISFIFIAQDDPGRHLIPVVVRPKDGGVPVGVYTGSFAGAYITRVVTVDEAFVLLSSTSQVQLRMMFFPDTARAPREEEVKVFFDRALQGDWVVPDGVTLYPAGIGVIQ